MSKFLGKLNEKSRKLIIALSFIGILITGMAVRDDYGVYCDYDSELPIVFMNIQAYGRLFLGDDSGYVQGLGDRDVTTDIERDHGAAGLYTLIPFSMIPSLRNDPHVWMMTVRAAIFFSFCVGLICLYLLVKEMTGRRLYALLAVLMLWLTPRFFAESTYNNKDAVTMACTIMPAYFGYKFLFDKKRAYLWTALFAFTSALATNMRMTGVILFGVIGLAYVVMTVVRKQVSFKTFLKGLAALVMMPVFYYLLTPAMWHGNSISFLGYLTQQSGNFQRTAVDVLVNGTLYNSNLCPPGPSYIFKYILIGTPPLILVFFFVGVIASALKIKSISDERICYRYVLMAFLVMLSMVVIIKDPPLYNGWRHMYFVYPFIVILAVCGVKELCDRSGKTEKVTLGAVIVQLISLCMIIVLNHPLEFSYYNFLAGRDAGARWDGDYWGVGMGYVLETIADEYGPCSVMVSEPIFVELNLQHLPDDVRTKVWLSGYDWMAYVNCDYIVENTFYKEQYLGRAKADWSAYTESDAAVVLRLEELEPVMEFKCGNQVLYEVYKNPFR